MNNNDKLELIAQLKHFHNECILCDKYLNNEFNTMENNIKFIQNKIIKTNKNKRIKI